MVICIDPVEKEVGLEVRPLGWLGFRTLYNDDYLHYITS